MKICKDGRVWGQNNKEASNHLGMLTGRQRYITTGYNRKKRSEEKMGDKNPMWGGGISSEDSKLRRTIEYRLWREAVYARDNWTCQKCGKQGVRLNAHHIKSFADYPELRFAIDNGQTLCLKCHRLTFNYCGRVHKLCGKRL